MRLYIRDNVFNSPLLMLNTFQDCGCFVLFGLCSLQIVKYMFHWDYTYTVNFAVTLILSENN
uniref:Uncharacterized protein n=1 Tax=Heterorhabditis bacteriophora TaxID=37862 RepID=A0A1I7WZ71_HETBA